MIENNDGFRYRLALVYGGIFLAIGAYVPFFPVWMKARGLTPSEISIIFAIPVFAKVVMSPVIAGIADRTGWRRQILSLLALGALLTGASLHFVSGFTAILVGVFILSLFWNPFLPLTEAVAIRGARSRGLDYGHMRLWGSLSFIAANLVGGWLVDRAGADAGLFFVIGAFVFTLLATLGLPPTGGALKTPAKDGPLDWRRLINPELLGFLALAALLQSSHAVYYLFSTLHWRSLGFSAILIGALWAIGVVSEILLFLWSARVVRFFGPFGLLCVAGVAAIVRWTALGFDLPIFWLFTVQILHGLTFGATHLAAVNFIADRAPEQLSGTAQSLNFALAGIATSLVTLAAGPLFASLNGHAYWVMAMLAAVAMAGLLVFSVTSKKEL